MFKTILVPATGNDTDNAVFASALAVGRAFDAHLEFLHVRADAAAMAAAMSADGSGAAMIGGLLERMEQEAGQREERAKALFQRFCEREGLTIAETPTGSARPLGAMASGGWRRGLLGCRARPIDRSPVDRSIGR